MHELHIGTIAEKAVEVGDREAVSKLRSDGGRHQYSAIGPAHLARASGHSGQLGSLNWSILSRSLNRKWQWR
jgi:hypothetical protein